MVEQGTMVKIHWVPSYIGVKGNMKSDEAVMETTERISTTRCLERFVSLTHVGRTISEIK